MVTRIVCLVGFMGAGKSSTGHRLARRLQLPFVDLDRLVEQQAGQKIAAIFATEGEPAFRNREEQALKTVSAPAIVALGGGAFNTPSVRDLVAHKGVSVFLDWPFEILFDRVGGDPDRPLAADKQAMQALYARRRPFYQRADIHWCSQPPHDEKPGRVAAEIADLLAGFPHSV